MREDIRQALDIDPSATVHERTTDITTVATSQRPEGAPRDLLLTRHRPIYLTGLPGPKRRDWLINLAAAPASRSTSRTVCTPTCQRQQRSLPTPRRGIWPKPEATPRRCARLAPQRRWALPQRSATGRRRRAAERMGGQPAGRGPVAG